MSDNPGQIETGPLRRPFRDQLRQQLKPAEYHKVPPNFSNPDQVAQKLGLSPDHVTVDHLTRLPVFEEEIRQATANKIRESLLAGQHVAVLTYDGDNLKGANNISNHFGDETIIFNVARVARALEEAQLGEKALLFRAKQAGDEVIVIIPNFSPEDASKLDKINNDLNSSKFALHIETEKQTHDYTISASGAYVATDHPYHHINTQTEQTIQWLKDHPDKLPYDFLNLLIKEATHRSTFVKLRHELEQIPLPELINMSLEQFLQWKEDRFGGERLSKLGHRILDKLLSIKCAIRLGNLNQVSEEYLKVSIATKPREEKKVIKWIFDTFKKLYAPPTT